MAAAKQTASLICGGGAARSAALRRKMYPSTAAWRHRRQKAAAPARRRISAKTAESAYIGCASEAVASAINMRVSEKAGVASAYGESLRLAESGGEEKCRYLVPEGSRAQTSPLWRQSVAAFSGGWRKPEEKASLSADINSGAAKGGSSLASMAYMSAWRTPKWRKISAAIVSVADPREKLRRQARAKTKTASAWRLKRGGITRRRRRRQRRSVKAGGAAWRRQAVIHRLINGVVEMW